MKTNSYPLSEAQKNILISERYYPDSTINSNAFLMKYANADVLKLIKAVNGFIRDNAAMRLVIEDINSEIPDAAQIEKPYAWEDIPVISLKEDDEKAAALIREKIKNKIDPTKKMYFFDIFTFEDGSAKLLCVIHHLVIDGYSAGQMFAEINTRYASDDPLGIGKLQRDYTELLKKDQGSLEYSGRSEAFWHSYLEEEFDAVSVTETKTGTDITGSRSDYMVVSAEYDALKSVCRVANATLPSVVMSLIAVYMSKISDMSRISIGSPYFNRLTQEKRETFGLFMTVLPVIMDVDPDETFAAVCENAARTSLSLMRHQGYPFGKIDSMAKDIHKNLGNLYNVVFNFLQLGVDDDNFSWESTGVSEYPLTVNVLESNGCLKMWYDYRNECADKEWIGHFHKSLMHMACQIADNPNVSVRDIHIALPDDEEAYRALNDTHVEYDGKQTVVTMLERLPQSDKSAIICEGRVTSYNDFLAVTDKIAYSLSKRGVKKGDYVAVEMKRSETFLFAVFGIIKAGAVFLPIDTGWPQKRKEYVIADSKAAFTIDDDNYAELVKGKKSVKRTAVRVLPEDPLYCIYTSGSTGQPKGVLITHKNAVNFSLPLEYNYLVKEIVNRCDNVLSIGNIAFDISISEYFPAVLNGKTLVLASDKELDSIESLTRCIKDNKIDCIQITPSRLQQYMEYEPFAAALENIKVVMVAAEVFPEELARRIQRPGMVLLNGYGPTETTMGASYAYITSGKMTIGKPISNVSMHILGRQGDLMPVGVAGELVIGGLGVGLGYPGLPELTKEKFTEDARFGRIYHTGDRALLNSKGEVEFLGRIDRQVKLHGLRIETAEIENVMLSYPGVNTSAVRVFGEGADAYLVGYYTSQKKINEKALLDHLSANLTYYMVPAIIQRISSMPLTPGGKVDYNSLKKPDVKMEMVPCNSREQEELHSIIAGILGHSDFGITTNLFNVGLTSLLSMKLNSKLSDKYNVEIGTSALMRHPTLIQIEGLVKGSKTEDDTASAGNIESVPLTGSQLGVWMDCDGDFDRFNYHLPLRVIFSSKVSPKKLKAAVIAAIANHPGLFSYVENKNGKAVIKSNKGYVPECKLERREDAETCEFIRPFHLNEAGLFEAAVYYNDEHTCLYFDAHHLICDGQSLMILLKDIETSYNGKKLAPEKETAVEEALKEKQLYDMTREENLEFYDRLFKDAGSVSSFRADKKGDNAISGELFKNLPSKVSEGIAKFAARYGVGEASILLSALSLLLSRYQRSDDVIIAVAENGRNKSTLDNTVGMFVRTLLYRFRMNRDETIKDMVTRAGNELYENMARDVIPYVELVSRYDLSCDVMFVYQNYALSDFSIIEKDSRAQEITAHGITTPKFGVVFDVTRESIRLEYNEAMYSEQSMKRILDVYVECILRILEVPESRLESVSIASSDDINTIERFNMTEADYSREETVVSCFERAADQNPSKLAFACGGTEYTYEELDRISNRIANALIKKGVKRGDTVSMMLNRNADTVPCILGILKSGAAYMPLDVKYPKERVEFILSESDAAFHITGDNVSELKQFDDDSRPEISLNGSDLCYILYTSGSTGTPKGVMVEHGNVLNYSLPLPGNRHITPVVSDCRASVVVGSLNFDITVGEIYPFLFCGKPVIFADDEEYLNASKLALLFEKYGIDFLFCTPTRLLQYLEDEDFARQFSKLTMVIVGGEVLTKEHLYRYRQATSARIFNAYGPTEITCACSVKEITDDEINIGSPLANVKFYVLDHYLKQMPIGLPGELYIKSRGVTRGYMGREDLTKKAYSLSENNERIYKSGDVVYWTDKGEIQYIGRVDFQIKLRGLRIELEEIEAVLMEYPGIDACKVLVMGSGRGQYLCAYVAAAKKHDEKKIKSFLAKKLTEYMVPSVFVFLDKMPTNVSGKIDANALRSIEVRNEIIPCKTKMQKAIKDILAGILHTEDFGINTDLYVVGLTSLLAMQMASDFKKEFDVEISSKEIMATPTIEGLEKLINTRKKQSSKKRGAVSARQNGDGLYPLTGSQMGIYADYDKDPSSTGYNIPFLYYLGTGINTQKLEDALKRVVDAHPYLKATVVRRTNDILIRRADGEKAVVSHIMIDGSDGFKDTVPADTVINGAPLVRPFVLEKGPLYRIEIYENSDGKVWLFMDFHHIVFDGTSNVVFLNDLKNVLDGKDPVKEQCDVFEAMASSADGGKREEAGKYFNTIFADVTEGSRIYYDGKDTGCNEAAYYTYRISESKVEAAKNTAARTRVSPGSVWFAAYLFTVSKFGNKNVVSVGTVENGRDATYKNDLVGMFVNTIPYTITLRKDMSVDGFIGAVHKRMQEVVSNSAYSYSDFVSDHGLNLDTHFVYNEKGIEDMSLDGGAVREIPILVKDARFTFSMTISGNTASVDYRRGVYREKTVKSVTEHMMRVISLFESEPDAKLDQLSIADEEDHNAYAKLNDTDVFNDHKLTMDRMFLRAVSKYPDRTAVVCGTTEFTYAMLGRDARRIAAGLAAKGIGKNDVVAFCLPRSLGTIQAIFGIICAGAAILPTDITWPEDRLDYVVTNSKAKLLITEDVLMELLSYDESGAPDIDVTSEDLSYVIYTSGSTGKPKGAMLIQRNLTNFLKPLEHNCLVSEMYRKCESILSISNITFDISICEIFPAIFYGRKLCFADERAFDSPRILAEFAKKNNVDCIQGTPSRISQYLEEEDFTKCLRNVKVMLVAGEALNHALADKIHQYSDTVILNGYGPTETTLAASYQYVTDKEITIGKPVANAKMYVVDEWLNLMPQGAVGELCIGGCNVGIGYIGRDDLTREKFVKNPFHPGLLYHSGDLARLNDDGEIDFLGRKDSQIKLHGLRIELDEIETVMAAHPLVTNCAVKVSGSGKSAYLCGYYMAKKELKEAELKEFMSKHLTYYMIPAVMVQMESMPISTAGKIDRQNLPDIAADDTIVECETKCQEQILEIVKEVLDADNIGITTDLFRLGLTSLLAVKINAGLYDRFNVELSSMDILKNPTVVQLEKLVESRDSSQDSLPENRRDVYPLTQNQMGVYVECMKSPEDLKYNIPSKYRIKSGNSYRELKQALLTAFANHPSMNAYVKETADGPVMVRNDEAVCDIIVKKVTNPGEQDFVRAFDLTKPLLYRAAIYYNSKETVLYLDFHHIIFDGESMSILLSEIKTAFEGGTLEKETIDTLEYGLVSETRKAQSYEKDREWLLERFGSDLNVTSVAPQKNSENEKSERISLSIPGTLKKKLGRVEKEAGVTESSVILAAFSLALSRITFRNDVVIATVWDGRNDRRLSKNVGMFVKTLPLGLNFTEDDTSFSLVKRVQQSVYDTAAHEISYAKFCQQTHLTPEILYVFQNRADATLSLGGYAVEEEPYEFDAGVKFPIVLNVIGSEIVLEYDDGKYEAGYMRRIAGMVIDAIAALCDADKKLIKDISLCPKKDFKLTEKWNATETDFPESETLVSLFEKQAAIHPDVTAVIGTDGQYDYDGFNRRSNRIANALLERGIKKEDIIAVKMRRTTNILTVFMGIMKAGAAYLPLDMNYPEERIRYLLDDSNAKLLVDDKLAEELLLCDDEKNPDIDIVSDNLCYIIYTSGSTGLPKGVMTAHRGVMDYCLPLEYNLHARTIAYDCSVSLAIGSLAFDIAVAEIYPFLLSGKTVVLAGDDQTNDVVELSKLIDKYSVDAMLCTPSRMLQYLEYEPFAKGVTRFKSVTAAGEAVPVEWLKKLKSITKAKLYNGYGPTEATCGSLFLEMNDDYVNIGNPLSNEKIYITDQWHNPLPVGMTGELCISGYGLSRGYLNRPELTNEKFIYSPYAEGRMYCTGDMARWNSRGEVEFIGRIDNQVKFHGYRIELGEIEEVLGDHPAVASCVVMIRSDGASQYLAAYYTVVKDVSREELIAHISGRLPHYMVPKAWKQMDKMPLDLNAKIDRRALPDIKPDGNGDYSEPATDAERAVCEVYASILNVEGVSATASFFDLGGDSIKGIQVTSRLLERGYRMQMRQLFETPTARELAKHLVRTEVAEEKDVSGSFEITGIQRFFLNNEFAGMDRWNQSVMLRLDGHTDIQTLSGVLKILCDHHDELRADFVKRGSKWIQTVKKPVKTRKDYILTEAKDTGYLRACKTASQSVGLKGVKLAAVLIKGRENDRIFVTAHHLVTDTVSFRILVEDMSVLLGAGNNASEELLAAKTTSYKTYAQKLTEYANSDKLWRERNFWKQEREVDLLPSDNDTYDSLTQADVASCSLRLDETRTRSITENVRGKVGMNEVLIAALAQAMHERFDMTFMEYVLEGHGREYFDEDVDVSRTVGWFTSFYPVYVKASDDMTDTLKNTVASLKSIPDNGFSYTVLKYMAGEKIDHNPQVLVNYLGEFDPAKNSSGYIEFCENDASDYDMSDNSPVMAPLSLTGAVYEGKLSLSMDYDRRRFEETTIKKLLESILTSVETLSGRLLNPLPAMPCDYGLFDISDSDWGKILTVATEGDVKEAENIESVYRANEMQSGMLLLYDHFREEAMYHEQLMLVIPEGVSKSGFEERLGQITDKYEALRSVFACTGSQNVYQVVRKNHKPAIAFADIRKYTGGWEAGSKPGQIMENYLKYLMSADREKGFEIGKEVMFRTTLIRATDKTYIVLFSFSHVILDKWSMDNVLKELFGTGNIEGRDDYPSYIKWFNRQNPETALGFWKDYMEDAKDTILPRTGPQKGKNDYTSLSGIVDDTTTGKLADAARRRNVTVSTLVQYAWGHALMKILDTDDVSFGYTWSGRPGEIKDVDGLVGMFIRTLPIRITEKTTCESLQQACLEIERYSFVSAAQIQKAAHLRHPAFRYFMTFQNTPGTDSDSGVYEMFNYNRSRNEFNVFVSMDKELSIEISYDRDLFEESSIEQLINEFIIKVKEI